MRRENCQAPQREEKADRKVAEITTALEGFQSKAGSLITHRRGDEGQQWRGRLFFP